MKCLLLITACSALYFSSRTQILTPCQYEEDINLAKKNMSEMDDGLTCANVAQFYTLMCKCTTTPQSKEEAEKLYNQILAIRKAYYDYGLKCKDFEELLPNDIPNCLVKEVSTIYMNSQTDNNNNTTYELFDENGQLITNPETIEDILNNPENNEIVGSYGSELDEDQIIDIINSLGGNGSTWANPSEGNCSMAAYNKFGDRSWSSSNVESRAASYEGYRCHCMNGTLLDGFTDASFDPKPLDTDKALRQIKGLRQNYYDAKKPGDPELSPLPSKCISNKNKSSAGNSSSRTTKKNFGDILASDELSNEITNFVSELSNYSSNPKIHQLASEMNQVRDKYDNISSKVNSFSRVLGGNGMDEETEKMMNAYENIEMGIAIGKAIFGKEPSLEDQLSDSQLAVRKYISDVSESLETIYTTVSETKPYTAQGMAYKDYIASKKNDIDTYDAVTSRERYICHWYLNFDGYPSSQDMKSEYSRLENMTVRQIRAEIQRIQDRSSANKNTHLMSKEFSFSKTYKELAINEEKLKNDVIIQYDHLRLHSNLNPNNIDLKVKLVEMQKKYDTAYYIAIDKQDLYFLQRSKNYNIKHKVDLYNLTPALYAAKLDRLKSFRFIQSDKNRSDFMSILNICSEKNSSLVFNLVFSENKNKLSKSDKESLINSAFNNSSDEVFAILIANNISYSMLNLDLSPFEEPEIELSRLLIMSAIKNNDIELLNEADKIKMLDDRTYFNELMKYSSNEYNQSVEELISRIETKNMVNAKGRGLLHHFVETENDFFTKQLIKIGYNQTLLDESGKSPLDHYVIRLEDEINRNSEIIEVYFDLKVKTSDGIPLLHHLLHIDRDNFEKYLISDTSSVNIQGLYGWTALHYAAKRGDISTCKYLLKHGASKFIRDDWGRTPFEVANERVGAQYSNIDKVSNDEYKAISSLLKVPFSERNLSLKYILRQ